MEGPPDLGGGEAGPEQRAVEGSQASRGEAGGILAAKFAGQELLDQRLFVDLAVGVGDDLFRELGGDAAGPQVAGDTEAAEALVLQTQAGVGFGEAAVVEIAVVFEAGEGGLDVGGVGGAAGETRTELGGGEGPGGEGAQRVVEQTGGVEGLGFAGGHKEIVAEGAGKGIITRGGRKTKAKGNMQKAKGKTGAGGCAAALLVCCLAAPGAEVRTVRVPGGGIQPQVVVEGGAVHLVYFQGEAGGGDLFYVRSGDEGRTWSAPVRVNSQPGSAVAAGTIRGAHLALGRGGRVHVAWNGSGTALPKGPLNPEAPPNAAHSGMPMLYARSRVDGKGFEPQRNLMQRTFGLDGGGSVAADAAGHVYVAWHGKAEGAAKGEAGRRVWLARSDDDGTNFTAEAAIDNPPAGACGCCGLRVWAGPREAVYVLYRSAEQEVHRDIHLLVSRDAGRSFRGSLVDRWDINACPMSSMAFVAGGGQVVGAWETAGQVYFGSLDPTVGKPAAAPGQARGRKHPVVARNGETETILVWTEGTGWQKGGSFAWQVYDKQGRPTTDKGAAPGIPVWSFPAVLARADGGFTIVY